MNERPRLLLSVQAGYACAEVGLNTVETVLRIYLLIFYTDVVGLQPTLAGVAVALGLVWDALIDPVMGAISDRTWHRFGGRRVYLPAGGCLLALGTLAVFWPPALDGQAAKFLWLLWSFGFLNTGMTVLSVPYMAMAGEMSEDAHERAVLFGWRFAFANVGAMLAAALPALFLLPGQASATAMGPVGGIAAALVALAALVSWRATRAVQFHAPPPAVREPFTAAFRAPLRNAAFRPLLLAYVTATIGIGVNAATALYYYQYRLDLTESQIQLLLVVFLGVFTLSILGWVRLARRYGKRRPLVVGAVLLGAGTTALYLVLLPGNFALPLVLGGIGLGSLVGSIVLIDTMLTDVLDHDLVRTGRLRSGLFFGVWRFASKLARAGSIAVAGLVLDVAGFRPNQDQTPAVDAALTWLFGPGVGVFFLLAGGILWHYRFDERKQAQVRRILDRRAARREAVR